MARSRGILFELKRRRVVRVAVGYLVVAWVAIQVVTSVFPVLLLPETLTRAVVLVAIVGLPIAMVLAWVFDITPGGLKRTEPAERLQGPGGRRPGLAGGVAVVLTIGLTLFLGASGWWALERRAAAADVAGAAASPGSASASVAVLPCDDLSSEPQAYFSDGITDEIIGDLARIEGLKVISRTSVLAFKDTNLTLPQIAATLAVRHVLECTVQRGDGRVRVRVRLVDPGTDTQLWSDTFESELTGIFSVQEEIARYVASALLTRVADLPARAPGSQTRETAAYDAYLRGTYGRYLHSPDGLSAGIVAFEEAIRHDPGYAPAYAGLASAHSLWALFGYPGDLDPYVRLGRALSYGERAVALDSSLAEAHAMLGHARLRSHAPPSAVLAELQQAVMLAPNAGEIRMLHGLALAYAGRYREGLHELDIAVSLDPLAPAGHNVQGMLLALEGRYEDALRAHRRARALEPRFLHPMRQEARLLLLLGRQDECIGGDFGPYVAQRAMCLHAAGHGPAAQALVDSLSTALRDGSTELGLSAGVLAGDIAEYHAWRGDMDQALDWLRLAAESSPVHQFLVIDLPTWAVVRESPAFRYEFDSIRDGIRERIERSRPAGVQVWASGQS